jgi:hypothetical protein
MKPLLEQPVVVARGSFSLALAKFGVFGVLWGIPISYFANGRFLIARIIAGPLLGFITLVAWDTAWHRRELRRRAFEEWLGRAAPIARQYKIFPTREPIWYNYFRAGLSPEQAVGVYRAALSKNSDL